MVSSILNYSNLVFAAAMVVSSTAVILAFFRHDKADISPSPPPLSDNPISRQSDIQILRPCLSSGEKRNGKKKKVEFAENVKKKKKETERKLKKIRCKSEIQGIEMPQNRLSLYNGILKDRSQRMEFSY